MDGWPGRAFIRMTIGWLTALVQPEAMAWMVMLAACLSVMLWEVAPVLHKLPVGALLTSFTESPSQKFMFPLTVTIGMPGRVLTVMLIGKLVEVPQVVVLVTEKLPDCPTRILCVRAPVLQTFPFGRLLVRVMLSPLQRVVMPEAVTCGRTPAPETVTCTVRGSDAQPAGALNTTLYRPVVCTVTARDTSPVFQVLF